MSDQVGGVAPVSNRNLSSGSQPVGKKRSLKLRDVEEFSKKYASVVEKAKDVLDVVATVWSIHTEMSRVENFVFSLTKIPCPVAVPFSIVQIVKTVKKLGSSKSPREVVVRIFKKLLPSLAKLGEGASKLHEIIAAATPANLAIQSALIWTTYLSIVSIPLMAIPLGFSVADLVKKGILYKALCAADSSFTSRFAAYERIKQQLSTENFSDIDSKLLSIHSQQLQNSQTIIPLLESLKNQLDSPLKEHVEKVHKRLLDARTPEERLDIIDQLLLFLKGLPKNQRASFQDLKTKCENIVFPYDEALCTAARKAQQTVSTASLPVKNAVRNDIATLGSTILFDEQGLTYSRVLKQARTKIAKLQKQYAFLPKAARYIHSRGERINKLRDMFFGPVSPTLHTIPMSEVDALYATMIPKIENRLSELSTLPGIDPNLVTAIQKALANSKKSKTELEKGNCFANVCEKILQAIKETSIQLPEQFFDTPNDLRSFLSHFAQKNDIDEVTKTFESVLPDVQETFVRETFEKALLDVKNQSSSYFEKMKSVSDACSNIKKKSADSKNDIKSLQQLVDSLKMMNSGKKTIDLKILDACTGIDPALKEIVKEFLGSASKASKVSQKSTFLKKALKIVRKERDRKKNVVKALKKQYEKISEVSNKAQAAGVAAEHSTGLVGVKASLRNLLEMTSLQSDLHFRQLLSIFDVPSSIAEKVEAADAFIHDLEAANKQPSSEFAQALQSAKSEVALCVKKMKDEYVEDAQAIQKLAKRTKLKIGLKIADIVLKIIAIVGAIMVLFPPLLPLGLALVVVGVSGSLVLGIGEGLFINKNPFDPKSRCAALRMVEYLKTRFQKMRSSISRKFANWTQRFRRNTFGQLRHSTS